MRLTWQEDEFQSLLDYYADVIVSRKKELQSVSKYVVADAYFSKENFISKLCNHGFEVVTRLRDDADLRYKYLGEKKKGRGRPQKYDGKVDYKQLKDGYFSLTQSDENVQIYSGIVYSKSLKKDINIVLLRSKRKQKWVHKIYMTTDLELSADKILQYYQTRFQIEFLYRDGKQHTGLNDSQARSKNKLNFHFNMSLTAINIAKVTHWLPIPKDQRNSFSMADVKTQYYNELLMKRFFVTFAIKPNLTKIKSKIIQLLNYGKIAA